MGRTRASIGPRLVTRSADLRTHLLGFGISAQPTTPFRSILDHYAATPKARKKESTYYSRTSKCKVNHPEDTDPTSDFPFTQGLPPRKRATPTVSPTSRTQVKCKILKGTDHLTRTREMQNPPPQGRELITSQGVEPKCKIPRHETRN